MVLLMWFVGMVIGATVGVISWGGYCLVERINTRKNTRKENWDWEAECQADPAIRTVELHARLAELHFTSEYHTKRVETYTDWAGTETDWYPSGPRAKLYTKLAMQCAKLRWLETEVATSYTQLAEI